MKRKKPGQSAVPDLLRDFTPTTQFRMRFYIYLAADWSTYDLNNTGEDGMHFLFLQTALSYRGVRMDLASFTDKTGSTNIPNLVYPWPPTCYNDTRPKAFFHIASPSGYGGTAKGVTRGRTDLCFDFRESANMQRWVLVEFAYRINSKNDGRASLWIDGIQRMADELIPPDPAYMNIGRIILSGYNSYPLPYYHTFYVDDIVVANDYNFAIGPTGGGTIRPRPMPPK